NIRERIWAVIVPTPGPYSTMVRARFQSTRPSRRSIKKRELGINDPSILGCWRKFFANNSVSSLRDGLESMLVIKSFKKRGSCRESTILASSVRCKENAQGGTGIDYSCRSQAGAAAYSFYAAQIEINPTLPGGSFRNKIRGQPQS